MSSITGIFAGDGTRAGLGDLITPEGPAGSSSTETIGLDEGLMSVTHLRNAPVKGPRYLENEYCVACFAGDLVGTNKVPFDLILSCLASGNLSALSDLRGNFAAAVFDKRDRILHLISDRKSQQPMYYLVLPQGVIFSTEMSAFCRLKDRPSFNRKWLYETIFFNFPIGGTTFLEGVARMSPASVWSYDLATKRSSTREYAPPFRPSPNPLRGDAALDRALSVVSTRFPEYYKDIDGTIAFGLSGGWDSRAALAFCPLHGEVPIHTYTYGVPGCDDLAVAGKVSADLGLIHREILFDNDFVAALPELIPETVYLSFGTLSMLRATMLYLHKNLTWEGEGFPIVVAGFSGDNLFRGHCNVPALVSRAMERVFRTGRPEMGSGPFEDMLGRHYGDFRSHVAGVLDGLRDRFGDLDRPECHLSYVVYEVGPKYFLGDMTLANRFSTLRVPFWDEDVIQLAYEIEYSTLTLSRFVPPPTEWRMENRLHAYLLSSNPELARLPMERIPLNVVLGSKTNLLLYRWLIDRPRKMLRMIRQPGPVPFLDWDGWVNSHLRMIFDDLVFSSDARIGGYLNLEFLRTLQGPEKTYWVGKLATVELILRMIENGWRSVPGRD